MADALEDEFALSDVGSDAGSVAGSSQHDGISDGLDDKIEPPANRAPPAKRRATNGGGNDDDDDDDDDDEEAARERKKQKRKAKKAKKAALNLATEPGVVARMPPDMQADHMLSLMRSCPTFSKLTELELDEVGVREPMLIDTTSMRSMERTLDTLAAFVKKAAPTAVQSAASALTDGHATGEPCIVVVTGNAQRAADISRALRSLGPTDGAAVPAAKSGKKVAVAKLFARHFKVAEQVQFLRSHICPLAVGTPQRLIDLLEPQPSSSATTEDAKSTSAALRLSRLRCIVLDASWCDQKQRTLLDGAETRQALFDFLATDAVRARMRVAEPGSKKSAAAAGQAAKIVLF